MFRLPSTSVLLRAFQGPERTGLGGWMMLYRVALMRLVSMFSELARTGWSKPYFSMHVPAVQICQFTLLQTFPQAVWCGKLVWLLPRASCVIAMGST